MAINKIPVKAFTSGDLITDVFTSSADQTEFTLSLGATDNSIIVIVNDVVQAPTIDYTVNGTTLTFGSALALNDEVVVRIIARPSTFGTVEDGAISSAKLATGAIETKLGYTPVSPTTLTDSVNTAVSGLVNSAPSTLNTLNELAEALGDDANFATTVTNALATKANSSDVNTALAAKLNTSTYEQTITVNGIKVPVLTSDPGSGVLGQIYYNSTLGSAKYYGSSGWKLINEPPLGSSSLNAATSCKAIVEAYADKGDGYYWINPGTGAIQLFCDMTFNPINAGFGRGWTKVAVGCQTTTGRYGTVQPTSITDQYSYTTEWKLSDTEIQALRTTSGIWLRGTSVHGSDVSRLLKITEAWHSNSTMGDDGGTNQQWNGSSWNNMTTCTQDYGPSQCTPSGWYFSSENYTSASAAASDLRWYYTGWNTYHCLFRVLTSGEDTASGPGAHTTYVY